MSEDDKQYFTLEQANNMIPDLEDAFWRILQIRGQVQVIYDRLEEAGVTPDTEDPDPFEMNLSPALAEQQATMHGLIDVVEEEIARLHERGCVVKGLDPALVDWYAKRDGEDIFLCWKLGEQEVTWWHEPREGFDGRRPVSDL